MSIRHECQILESPHEGFPKWPIMFTDADIITSRPFFEKRREVLFWGSVAVSAVSAVSAVVLPYISVAIKASFLKLGMCNICKSNIAKMFLDFFKI